MLETLKNKFDAYSQEEKRANKTGREYFLLSEIAKDPEMKQYWLDKANIELEQSSACLEQMEYWLGRIKCETLK